jgi:putative membrane protein
MMEHRAMTTASVPKPFAAYRYRLPHVLGVIFAGVVVLSGIRPVTVWDWWLENVLVFVGIGVLIGAYKTTPLSDLSYILLFIFLCMHEWGAHYRYAIDPVGEWMKQTFGTVRNDYDRVVHFAFGLLLAYPQREVLIQKTRMRGVWALTMPILTTIGFGAIYELIEVGVAWAGGPEIADAFLGLQGDPWDTHKDLAVALAGASLAMGITGVACRTVGPARNHA